MCNFFSCISDGKGNVYYFDHAIRKKIIKEELSYETDSHTSIADYHGFKGAAEDKMNKFEYNPLTKVFTVDQINTADDSAKVMKFCEQLDFKTIVPELIIKPIVHPLNISPKKITKADLELLKDWDSVRASVWDSVGASVWDSVVDSVWASVWDSVWASVWDSVVDSVVDSVWASVRASVWASVFDSVWDSVGASVLDSVRDSVGASVLDSVRDSVLDSVRASVWAYYSSFFNIKYKHDFSPAIKLWEKGLVPSFDGKIWRLHGGKDAKILWSGEIRRKGNECLMVFRRCIVGSRHKDCDR